MNWIVFALVAWVVAGMEIGLASALELGHSGIAPGLIIVLLVYISLWAKLREVVRVALILGVLMDLSTLVPTTAGFDAVIVGPWALGSLVAALMVNRLRSVMFRQSAVTLAWLTLVAALVVHTIVLVVLGLRSSYDIVELGPLLPRIGQAAASSLYTAIIALPMGWFMQRTLTRPLALAPGRQLNIGSRR